MPVSRRLPFVLLAAILLVLGVYVRSSGLFRGLDSPSYFFHPDELKSVSTLFYYLQGEYVHYFGDRFYDGYPYGLNHLDEWFIRPVLFFLSQQVSDYQDLIYWARGLRVIYGMMAVVLGFVLVAKLFAKPWLSLLALFLLATSPLMVVVSHTATGDIGTYLFSALSLFALFYYVTGVNKRTWIVVSGFCVGASFACKYNGVLIGITPGIVLLFQLYEQRSPRIFISNLFLLLIGVVVGCLVFTPAIILDFDTTITNMFNSFRFVKNYNVTVEILKLSFMERAWLGLSENALNVCRDIGIGIMFSALTGLVMVVWQQVNSKYKQQSRQVILLVSAIIITAFLSLLVSLVGKITLQSFHFSYLYLPFTIAACFAVYNLFCSKMLLGRIFASLLVGGMVWENSLVTGKGTFFWCKDDTKLYVSRLATHLYEPPGLNYGYSRLVTNYLELHNLSAFRNLYNDVLIPFGTFWQKFKVVPLPQIPGELGRDWIFLNGPAFPKNERMLYLHGGRRTCLVERYLVLSDPAKIPAIGVRAGSYPIQIELNLGGDRKKIDLAEHSQTIVQLTPEKIRMSKGRTQVKQQDVYLVKLEALLAHDDAWVTVLGSEEEKNNFQLYGGELTENPPDLPDGVSWDEMLQATNGLKYQSGTGSYISSPGHPVPFMGKALAAGRYILELQVMGLVESSSFSLNLDDARGNRDTLPGQTFTVNKGRQTIRYSFAKPFVPYQCRMVVTCNDGMVQLGRWRVMPDVKGIEMDFNRWRSEGVKPV